MRHPRRAAAWIGLLVLVLVIGMLFVLVVVGLFAARESARRNVCANNMKQLNLGLQAYVESNRRFPPSSMWERPEDIETANSPHLKANWVIQLLPYLDSQPLADLLDHSPATYLSDDVTPAGTNFNQQGRGVELSFMLCPADREFNLRPYNGACFGQGNGWARGNYAANGGAGFLSIKDGAQCGAVEVDGVAAGCAALDDSPGWQSVLHGVMGAALQPERGGLAREGGLGIERIKDGMSHTILIGEIRAGIAETDPRGVWAMSGGSSSFWACTSVAGGDNGPNANGASDGDSFPQCQQVMTALGITPQDMHNLGMPCYPSASKSPHWQQTVRSNHPGGANIGMCDGSVRFLSDTVEIGSTPIQVLHTDRSNLQTFNLDQLSVWDRLIMASDRQVIAGDEL